MTGRGGAGRGQGRKPRLQRYVERKSIGRRALEIGQRCEVLFREAYPTPPGMKPTKLDYASSETKRPWDVKRHILKQAAEEFGETKRMVRTCWDDYRRLEKDLDDDLD